MEKRYDACMYGQQNANSLYCRAVGLKEVFFNVLFHFPTLSDNFNRTMHGFAKKKKKF